MECEECGIAIKESAAVAVVQRSFHINTKVLCRNCRARNRRNLEDATLLIGLAIAPLAALVGRENPVLAIALLVTPIQLISTPLHELGHTLVGWFVGMQMMQISLGRGRRFAHFWIGQVLVELHRIPFFGYVRGTCMKQDCRWRTACFVLGGVFVNALLLTFAILMLTRKMPSIMPNHWSWSMIIYAALAWTSLMQLINNLIPRTVQSSGRQTDGRLLLRLFREPMLSNHVRERRRILTRSMVQCAGGRIQQAHEYLARELSNHPNDIHLLMQLGYVQIKNHQFQSAIDLYQNLLLSVAVDSQYRALLLNNLAWAYMLNGDADQMDLADAYSAQAIAIQPDASIFRGTRGSILVLRGEPQLGLPLLKQAMIGADSDASCSSGAAFTALAHHQIGDEHAARRWMRRARKLDRCNEVLPLVQKRLAHPETDPDAVR